MAKVCVQCEKKIGLFKSAIDEIYCSYACRDAARKDIADNQQRAKERAAEAERAAQQAAAEAKAQAAQAKAEDAVKHTCPKCGAAWKYTAGPPESGACDKCGFSSEFTGIEKCPTCTGMSLVVSAAGARCPRCKFRRD